MKTHNLLPDAFECASQVLKNEEKIMALLNILQYPDERLHTVAKPVEQVDERIQKLVADMFETMYEARGIGLAATQVDVHERVVVMDLTEDHSEPRVFITPSLLKKTAKPLTKKAACPCRAFTTPLPAPSASRSRL